MMHRAHKLTHGMSLEEHTADIWSGCDSCLIRGSGDGSLEGEGEGERRMERGGGSR